MLTTVLFDLDGTLLPMDQDIFAKVYFSGLAKKAAPHGYEPTRLIDTVWQGTACMVKNDGVRTNEAVFWDHFAAVYGEEARRDITIFDAFYEENFHEVQKVCGFAPRARSIVRGLRDAGLRVVLATNPLFPQVATHARIRWAGLEPTDFELITTYENACYCKPNPDYYRDILARLSLSPETCVMVGNDVAEDMIAETLGMQVFLLTDCLINKKNADISRYPHGDIDALADFLTARTGCVIP